MLIHIVCWKYKDETARELRTEHLARLNALAGLVPGITSFDAGSDILQLDRSFDTGLVARFTDRLALDHYTVHPEHQRVAALGKEISEKVVSVDFFDPSTM